MSARREKTPKTPKAQQKKTDATPPSRPMMEKALRDVHKLLEEHRFQSVEEAKAFLTKLTGTRLEEGLQDAAPLSPQEQAQELAWDAMEAATAKQARKLAKQALQKDPDCVDALITLTETDATSPDEAIAGMEKAVAAGERSLGEAFFGENKGHFWGLLRTRPYMRARYELADLLLDEGRRSEGMAHFEALLELNPNDNQGVRDILLGCYLAEDNLEGARRLLRDYRNDESALFSWGHVLESFLSGDLEAARRALNGARRRNRFVEGYLSGEMLPPKDLPDEYALGSKEEAIFCLIQLGEAWARHPEAMVWIWEQTGFAPVQNQVFQDKLF